MATPDEMIDDQILMDSIPASREFVLPEERKMYRGFQMPAGMSTEQEVAYKAAIDEREDFGSKAARQLPRIADDVRESIRGVGRSAIDVGKAAGDMMTDAALTVPRAKVAMYADPEGSEEFARSVVAGDREARQQLATGASESMVEPAATMGDVALTKYAVEEGRFGEAAITGAAVLLPYVSAAALRAIMKGGSKAADDAAKQLADLESGLKDGTISETQAKEIGESIEQVFSATADITSMGTFPGYTARSADFMKVKDRVDLPEEMDRIDYDERRDFRRSLYTKEGVDAANLEFRRALYTKKTFPEAMEVVERRFMLESEPFKRVLSSEIAGVEPSIQDLRALNSIEADEIKSALERFAGRTDYEAQEFMDRLQSLGGKTPGGGEDVSLDLMNVRDRTAGISEGTQALDAEINAFQQSDLGNKLLGGSDQDFDRYEQMIEQIKAKYPDEVVKAETYGIRGLPVTILTVEEVENAGSNTIAKQFSGTRLAQDVLAQLDDVPNKNLDDITSRKTIYGQYADQYSELLDVSNLSDEQLELLRKRHASVSSPELGAETSFKLERGTAGLFSRPRAELEDARDRMQAIGTAVRKEQIKRSDIRMKEFDESNRQRLKRIQQRMDARKKQ